MRQVPTIQFPQPLPFTPSATVASLRAPFILTRITLPSGPHLKLHNRAVRQTFPRKYSKVFDRPIEKLSSPEPPFCDPV